MSDDRAWIGIRVGRAGAEYELLPEWVAARLEDLLRVTLIEGRLTKTEVAKIATELLDGMEPAPVPTPSQGQRAE